jgi:TolB-like protein
MNSQTKNSQIVVLVLLALLFSLSPCRAQEDLTVKLKELSAEIASHAPAGKPMKIAVAAFGNPEGKVSPLGKFVAEQLTTLLFETGKFRLIQRPLIEKAVAEQQLEGSNLAQPDQVKRICKAVRAKALLTGTFTDLGASLGLNARLLSADKAEILSAGQTQVTKDETVKRLLAEAEPNQPVAAIPTITPAAAAKTSTRVGAQGYPAQLGEFGGLGISLEDILEESTTLKVKFRYHNQTGKSRRLFFRKAWLMDETGAKVENISEVGFEGEVTAGATKLGFVNFPKPEHLDVPFELSISFEVGNPDDVLGEPQQIDVPSIHLGTR